MPVFGELIVYTKKGGRVGQNPPEWKKFTCPEVNEMEENIGLISVRWEFLLFN